MQKIKFLCKFLHSLDFAVTAPSSLWVPSRVERCSFKLPQFYCIIWAAAVRHSRDTTDAQGCPSQRKLSAADGAMATMLLSIQMFINVLLFENPITEMVANIHTEHTQSDTQL